MHSRKLGKDLSLIYRYSQIYFDSKLKEYGLGSGQYIFLVNMLNNDGINQKQLSEIVRINKATTARAVEKLINEKYLIKKTDETDKRVHNLYITDKARTVKDELFCCMESWNQIMLHGLDEEERETLFMLIDKISSNIIRHSDKDNYSLGTMTK